MKQSISLLCLIGCVAICAYSSDTEKNQQTLEVANDDGSRSLNLTAVYMDKALHAISQGLRDTAQQSEHAADENEYFFKNLWKNTKKSSEGSWEGHREHCEGSREGCWEDCESCHQIQGS
uniref:Putative secreted protein n=1 Tax=Rhipicephalus microplus TaxID=6941 RepID=A0A6G5A1M2_RHIMP